MRTRSKPPSSCARAKRAVKSASTSGPAGARTSDDSCVPIMPMNSTCTRLLVKNTPMSELPANVQRALADLAEFPLLDALYGRRSRRFPLGGEIPDGVLAFKSRHAPQPLSD